MSGKVRVTLVRSRFKSNKKQEAVLVGLNLRKRHHSQVLEDTPAIRGMIRKVEHLVLAETV